MGVIPVASNVSLELGLSRSDLFGEVRNGRFVVHKLPEHVVQIYQAFGCNEFRLLQMHRAGVTEALIFFHPDANSIECYKVGLQTWLNGIHWENKTGYSSVEKQRLVLISDCKKI